MQDLLSLHQASSAGLDKGNHPQKGDALQAAFVAVLLSHIMLLLHCYHLQPPDLHKAG